jgi:hypothetical protein
VAVENPKTFNGIKNLKLNIKGMYHRPQVLFQYLLVISLNLSEINNDKVNIDFGGIEFANPSVDTIYATNNINFSTLTSFTRLDYITVTADTGLKFGPSTDIFYFTVSDSLNFDIYIGKYEKETGKYFGIKDESRKITKTKKLYDIAGNEIYVEVGGKRFNVYVKYQSVDLYSMQGSKHYAFN